MLSDVLLVAVLFVFALAKQILVFAPSMAQWGLGEPPPTPLIVLWAAAFAIPLLWRRRFPCTVLVITAAHFGFFWLPGEPGTELILGATVYSASAYGEPRRAAWCFGLSTTALLTWGVVDNMQAEVPPGAEVMPPGAAVVTAFYGAIPFVLGWALGYRTRVTRTLREYRAVLEQRNDELTVEREANARRAVLEERVRIARELHDVVAHHVSLMGIQAGVAQRLFHTRPGDALEAVGAVQTGSRQAITDLQQLLGVLRGAADPANNTDPHTPTRPGDCETSEPAPDLGQLPALLATIRSAGLPVDFTVQGHPQPLPPALELSTYRIVQEALTNTLKHADAARAGVTISYHPDAGVEVEIVDNGHAHPHRSAAAPGGRGLIGMQERVDLHGGELDAGPQPAGGYRVHAVLGLS